MGIGTNILLCSVFEALALTRLAPGYLPVRSYWATVASLFLLQFTVWAVFSVFIYPLFLSPLRDLPEPKGNGIITGQFGRIAREVSGAPAREWMQTIPNNGLIRYRGLFNRERVLVTSPKALSEVLVQKSYEFIKPPQVRWTLGRLLGIGVLLAEGDEHKQQRRLLMPAFSYRHIKDLYPIFWSKGREVVLKMTEALEQQAKDGSPDADVLDVGSWASRVTLDIIGVAGMGKDFNAVQDPSSELNQCYRRVFQPNRAQRRMAVLAIFFPFWLLNLLPMRRNHEVREARALVRRVARSLIAEKKAKLEKSRLHDVDILSVALTSGGFADDNLVDQLMTFLAAGHETTASAMQWAVYFLCAHPDVQSRLRAEVTANLPSLRDPAAADAPPPTAESLDKLRYLHAVAAEILRFAPPVPLTMRVAASRTATILAHPIPEGTIVVVPPWAVNHDPARWGPDAHVFNPDRWLASNAGGADSNFAFLTFLHGPRSCIGERFARAEFAALLAAWVGAFEMSFKDEGGYELDVVGGVTVKPSGMRVRLKSTGW